MEIEMKAPLNADQLEALLTKEKIKNYTFSSQRELLIKSDIYYSFGGERLKKPKEGGDFLQSETVEPESNPGDNDIANQENI